MSATASTKLPRGKRENKHKENIPVVQSCHGGLLNGSILMVEQKAKPKSSMIKLALLPAEMGSGHPAWASGEGNHSSGWFTPKVQDKEHLQAAVSPDITEMRAKEMAKSISMLWDYLLLFWKRKCSRESGSQGNTRGGFCALYSEPHSLSAQFPLFLVHVSLDQTSFF